MLPERLWHDSLWYAARGVGVVSLVLLTAVVVLGITARSGRPAFGLPRFAVTAVHRNATLLVAALLAVHAAVLLADPYAHLTPVDLVVPFAAGYRPLWLGFGTLAFDLILAVLVTSLLRHRIGRRGWRTLHWLAYAAWPVGLVHGLGTGTDAGQLWVRGIAAGCVAAVVVAVVWRFTSGFAETAAVRRLGGSR